MTATEEIRAADEAEPNSPEDPGPVAGSARGSPLPSVDLVLRSEFGRLAVARFGRMPTTTAVRDDLEARRALLRSGEGHGQAADRVAARVFAALERADRPSQRRVINLTGTVLHTNLGRAILPEEAVEAVVNAMRAPTSLEFDLASGERGERDDHVRGLVRELTGAEDAVLVNNNAAAVLLVLSTLSRGRETIVSRGELIEIGGAFRIPEIMKQAGAILREVGTTNRTHATDFETAIGPETGLVLKVHASNYAIRGFTAEVSGPRLAAIARGAGIPYVEDLGSGTLIDLARRGLPPERTVAEVIKEGADLVTFSGDKLLGGPQAGFIAGRKDLVRACERTTYLMARDGYRLRRREGEPLPVHVTVSRELAALLERAFSGFVPPVLLCLTEEPD